MTTDIEQIPVSTIDGVPTTLGDYAGKVRLIVNVASKCGLTPQYAELESLYRKYRDRGLEILAFPANEFGAQEPGTAAEIKEFCSTSRPTPRSSSPPSSAPSPPEACPSEASLPGGRVADSGDQRPSNDRTIAATRSAKRRESCSGDSIATLTAAQARTAAWFASVSCSAQASASGVTASCTSS